MVIRHEDLVGTYEQKRALVNQFNLMDDTFFSKVPEDKAACEYLLTALLGKPIKVIENKTQYSIRSIENHSVVLDAFVEDGQHKLYNVEIQVGDKKNHERRLRYYRAAIDLSYLGKGRDYSELPELYMIFISDFEPFGLNRNHYKIVHYVKDFDKQYDDGVHMLYFNTEVKDNTGLSKLLQYLARSEAGNTDFGALSKMVNFYKIKNEGVDNMCKAVEEYAREYGVIQRNEGRNEGLIEGKIEVIRNMLAQGLDIDTALGYVDIDRKTYEEYEKLQ
ncbi:MAG: Rpn family recombination-promoting nuclease/putative transposase [Oscillospiraceae bacterium]|nr:Rpn family recombination-promoting nuclease/putative transposase [Oscillospiraceae bacterium]